MSTVRISFQETSILNKFCFPWWYYPLLAFGKWGLSAVIAKIMDGFDSRENTLKGQPLLMTNKKYQKAFNILREISNLPNDITDEILSYVTFEMSDYEVTEYVHNQIDFRIFSGYLLLYIIMDGLLNLYCWYMAINYWIDTFKIETKGWNRYVLLSFDSLFILPSYVPINVAVHCGAFLDIIQKKLEYYEQYYSTTCCGIIQLITALICLVLGILEITPFLIAVLPAFYCIIVPGMFIAFPVTLIALACFMCFGFQMIMVEEEQSKIHKWCQITVILSGVIIVMISYGGYAIIFTTTVCVFQGNRWGQCVRYGFASQYCPKFNFDYTLDSWIWIIKWALF